MQSENPLLGVANGEERTPLISPVAPSKGHIVYASFIFLGLGTLLPWNIFITAESYWQYKFRNTTDPEWPNERTTLQHLYTPMQVCFSQITNFTFLFINALFSQRVPQKTRLVGSLSLLILCFSVTTAFVRVDTDTWQTGFFATTMLIIVIMNMSGAIFQGGLFGLAGMFPQKFMTAVVAGQALGGVFASISRIASLALGADTLIAAFIYFMISVAVMLLTMAVYLDVSTTRFYKYYALHRESQRLSSRLSANELIQNHKTIFEQIWPLGISVSFVFLVTLGAFPAVCVKVVSASENRLWADKYFQPVATFLLFNVGDYVGRQLAGIIAWPERGSRLLYWMIYPRVIFIPLFLLCNHDAKSTIPVFFFHDFWYIAFMIIFALSNGYTSALCMMYAPSLVGEADAEKAGSMMGAMLGLGLLLGAASSFAFALIT